jgi:hypothetical protein
MLRGRSDSRVTLLSVWMVLAALHLSGQSTQKAQGLPAENKQHAKASRAYLHGAPPAAAKPSAAVDSVEVINGSARQTQVFDAEQQAPMPPERSVHAKTARRGPQRNTVSAPSVPDVEVINGAQWETRRFDGFDDEIASPWIERNTVRPVVVDVISSESVRRRGNTSATASTAPIVVGIGSSEAEGHGESAKPIAYRIAPGPPKRPPYHPTPSSF